MTTLSTTDQGGSLLLGRLSIADSALLLPHLDEVSLIHGDVIVTRGSEITHAYFPETAVLSVINNMDDGSAVEMGTIGNEGFSEIGIALDTNISFARTVCQIPGVAQRIPASLLADACERSASLRQALNRYAYAFLSQVGQTAACNARHPIEQRCVRWLLLTHDRVGGADTFPLKHEYLAMMLGVRRTGVTIAAGALQELGLIRYRRGMMRIMDRPGLEARACECYRVVREQFLGVRP